jgi:hypothetical protein
MFLLSASYSVFYPGISGTGLNIKCSEFLLFEIDGQGSPASLCSETAANRLCSNSLFLCWKRASMADCTYTLAKYYVYVNLFDSFVIISFFDSCVYSLNIFLKCFRFEFYDLLNLKTPLVIL